MEISVVLPVYNSASTLQTLVGSIVAALEPVCTNYEVILVNDGSVDDSWSGIKELASLSPAVVPINLARNYGEHNATLCGLRAARYPITVTLDDDLQNPPEEIFRLVRKLEDGFDVIYGSPQKEQHGLLRDLASQITKLVMQKSMGVQGAISISSFRAFRTRLREAFAHVDDEFVNIDVLLSWSAATYGAMKVKHYPRYEGRSSYNLERLIRHAVNMISGYTLVPLQFASLAGLLCIAVSIIILGGSILEWMHHGHVMFSTAFFAFVITAFIGTQLIALGVIGEYLGRINSRTMKRPTYVVKEAGSHQTCSSKRAGIESQLSGDEQGAFVSAGAR